MATNAPEQAVKPEGADGQSNGLGDHALQYAARGWSILPVSGKIPTVRSWKRYQKERPSEEKLRTWFDNGKADGLAVVCGKVSGDLVVRDFDAKEAYQSWADEYPQLAEILPTVRTARGFHVYFTGELERIIEISSGDEHQGELRGAGYVLLPPSRHPSGREYEWTIPLSNGRLPAVDAVRAGLIPAGAADNFCPATSVVQSNQRRQRLPRSQRQTEKTEEIRGCALSKTKSVDIDAIIDSTLPTGPGQRNRAVFKLARALKGEPAYANADPAELEPIVRAWHKLALPVIRTKPFEETLIDFLKAWAKVKYPKGAGPMDIVFERMNSQAVPKVATRYEQPKMQQLVLLCRELQRNARDGPFYLGCRIAGKLLDVPHTTVNRWLFLLCQHKVIREQEKGGQAGTRYRASRYFYVADD